MPVRTHPVKVALAVRGITQVDFAPQAGVKPSTLGQVLNGHQASWPALRRRVADALQLPESELFPESVSRQDVA